MDSLNINRCLTAVVAPAGYGKTTSVVQWIQQLPKDIDVNWLSLDEMDNDLSRFLTHFTHLLDPDGCSRVADDDIFAYLTHLSNQLINLDHPRYIVLDNYHVIQNEAIHKIIHFFFINPIPSLRFIVLSRASLPFDMAKLRLQKRLVEITTHELRFQQDETQAYLGHYDIGITPTQLDLIVDKTQGWIACLEILILRLQTSTDFDLTIQLFSGTDHYLTEFFHNTFYGAYPYSYQEFLTHTSILDPMTTDLCNAVLDIDDAYHYLTHLQTIGAPIHVLDANQTTFQYHPLYKDFLAHQLQLTDSPNVTRLHQRAYTWYKVVQNQTENTITKALDHANYVSQDALLNLLEYYSPIIHRQGHSHLFLDYLNLITNETLLEYPTLLVAYLWAMFTDGQIYKANVLVEQAEQLLPNQFHRELYAIRTQLSTIEDDPQTVKTLAHQTLTMLSADDLVLRGLMHFNLARLAFFYDGQTHQAIRQITVAIDLYEQASHFALWSIATDCLIAVRQRHGSLVEAEALCRYAITTCEQTQQPNLSGTFYSQLGKILYERNYLQEAEQILRQGRKLSRQYQGINSFLASSLTLARIVEPTEAQEILDEARDIIKTNGYQLARLGAFPMSHLAEHGWIAPHIQWDKHSYDPDHDTPTVTSLYTYLELARQLCIGKIANPRKAITLLLKLENLTSEMSQRGSLIEVLILLAYCYHAVSDTHSAQFALERAILIAQHTGHKRLFLDLGEPITQLLEKISTKRQYADYALQLINTTEQQSTHSPRKHLSMPLTLREKDILRLLGEGYSNPEISHYFDISVSTTRWHVKNIYRKLDVNNRTRATVRARDLGLI